MDQEKDTGLIGWVFDHLNQHYYQATLHGYRAILADPPWRFRTWSETRQYKSASRHYPVMHLEDIRALPVADLCANDCALFLWAISPMLPQAFSVIDAWGFKFKTVAFVWTKTSRREQSTMFAKRHFGLGYWTRANAEYCLLATRGKPKRNARDVSQLVVAPVQEHSRKPDCVHDRIKKLVPGPYLELFARRKRAGWDAWGNELEKKLESELETAA